MGMRKQSGQNVGQYLGANLHSGEKGMRHDDSMTSVGSAQKKVGDNFVAPMQMVKKTQ